VPSRSWSRTRRSPSGTPPRSGSTCGGTARPDAARALLPAAISNIRLPVWSSLIDRRQLLQQPLGRRRVGQALDTALALAGRVAANAPLAVRRTLRLMLELPGADDETAFRESGKAMMGLADSEDFWEGPKAFLEKREPEWKGR